MVRSHIAEGHDLHIRMLTDLPEVRVSHPTDADLGVTQLGSGLEIAGHLAGECQSSGGGCGEGEEVAAREVWSHGG